MLVCYDLQLRVPTYDFFIWLVHARLLGATAVNISRGRKFLMRKKWKVAETEERIHNYILPGPPLLAGMPCKIGDEGIRSIGSEHGSMFYVDLLNAIKSLNKPLPLLRTDIRVRRDPYSTVTLRRSPHLPERNSEEPVWRAFAAHIKAIVVEDYSVTPISLQDRMALYASAQMNYGVPTGPMGLLELTPYPVTVFADPIVNERNDNVLTAKGQRPWALPHQRIVWTKPTLDVLLKHHRERR